MNEKNDSLTKITNSDDQRPSGPALPTLLSPEELKACSTDALRQKLHELQLRYLDAWRQISECSQTEQDFKDASTLRRMLFEQSPDGILIIDPATKRFLEFNSAAHRQLGYSRQEFAQLSILDLDVLETEEETEARIADVIRRGRDDFETLQRTRQGEIRHVHVIAQTIEIQGRLVYHCIWRDITERKQNELILRESEERLRAITQSAKNAILMMDPSGSISFWNPAAERIFGYAAAEVIGKNLHLLLAPRRYHEAFKAAIVEFQRSGQGNAIDKTLELQAIHRDGHEFPMELSLSVLNLADGWHSVGIIHDITERKRAEELHKHLQEQVNQAKKMESIGRLAGGVAHDYNNMLSIILGYTQMALEAAPPGSALQHQLQQVLGAAERSAEVTKQLLGFARKQPIVPKVLNLNESIEQGMLQMLRRLIGENIDLAWKPKAKLGKVKIDASQLDQILANLCVNARDAINGIGKITVETDKVTIDEQNCVQYPEATPGQYVVLTVQDNGCGIEGEMLNKVFEPFFTTKATGAGTGLGLATVYGIVKQNNGFIQVESEPGLGTTFAVYLPRHLEHDESFSEPDQTIALGQGIGTILVVEDEKVILEMTKTMLQRHGYTALAASSPSEALALAMQHRERIHLLLTDVIMPEMNGKELAEQLQAIHPEMKLLFMSGYTADVIAAQGGLPEALNFIQKPFSRKVLIGKVCKMLAEN